MEMTIRTLPEIKALDSLSGIGFAPPDDVLVRWKPEVRAADDGDISIYDVIGEDSFGGGITTKRIAAALRSIGARDVTVNINSPGGDFFEGIAIYNLLRDHPHKVTVKVIGLAASAGSVIAMAGDDIQVSEVGFLMVHNAWAVAIGNRHDMRAAADLLEPFDDAMAGLYASRAGVKRDVAADWMDKETWFNGQAAVDAGLADSVLGDAEIDTRAAIDAKGIAAVRRVESALARQGMPRSERRALIGEITGRPAVADAGSSPAVAGDQPLEVLSSLRALLKTLSE